MVNSKIKFCPMLTGKEEVKALMIGRGDCVIPIFRMCIQEHCAAFIRTVDGKGKCNHYHAFVDYEPQERSNEE